MLATIAVTILGLAIFLFLFWKRLKEDYAAEIIFKAVFFILIGMGIGWASASYFFPIWFFWMSLIGGTIGLMLAVYKFRVKFYETLEAFVISSLPWLGLIFLRDSAVQSSLNSFLAFVVILLIVFVSYYLDTHYKRFTWYKSGKIGFTGAAVALIFFLVRTAIAIVKVPMLSFIGRGEVVISGVMVLVSFGLLFSLGKVKK